MARLSRASYDNFHGLRSHGPCLAPKYVFMCIHRELVPVVNQTRYQRFPIVTKHKLDRSSTRSLEKFTAPTEGA